MKGGRAEGKGKKWKEGFLKERKRNINKKRIYFRKRTGWGLRAVGRGGAEERKESCMCYIRKGRCRERVSNVGY